MRPNQQNNKQRSRNRGNNNNNRRGGNPLSRNYESNGPDVRVRGNAAHIAEKYVQLARDASSSGDLVMAENYLQHAEHYFRIISAAQAQFQPRQDGGYAGDRDEADDEGFEEQRDPRQQFARTESRDQREPERVEDNEDEGGDVQPQPQQQARRQRRAPQAEPAEAGEAPVEAVASEEGESRPRRARRPRRPRVSEDDGANAELPAFLTGGQETAAE